MQFQVSEVAVFVGTDMGVWGHGPLENDPANDVRYRWDDWIKHNSYTPEQATENFIRYWGDSVRYGDAITNHEIIALLAIQQAEQVAISGKFKKIAAAAINRELTDEFLQEWDSPSEREQVLRSLLKSIGASVKRPRKPTFFSDPALCFRNTGAALETLKKLGNKKVLDFYTDKKMPWFLRTLNRLFNSQIWEKDYKVWEQAQRERLMMTSFYLAKTLNLSEEERNALVEKSANWPKT